MAWLYRFATQRPVASVVYRYPITRLNGGSESMMRLP
ncbi:hypothetical protein BCL79_2198 [Stenotrophomonas rhizophila]|uniref:Uncharacterized protein n=1 Tax=Stenotrophomonas rhizophila TaxID=216778 RepID=A0A498CRA2_9GAMM|nr:hypothetical protein BCL79_2198 [Stenotrophomonas rhizophila]